MNPVLFPGFLNAAGNHTQKPAEPIMVLRYNIADPVIGDFEDSANFYVTCTKNGVTTTTHYSDETSFSVEADANTDILIKQGSGSSFFTNFSLVGDAYNLVSIKIENTDLTGLEIVDAFALSDIILSNNSNLGSLTLEACPFIKTVDLSKNVTNYLESVALRSLFSLDSIEFGENKSLLDIKTENLYSLHSIDLSSMTHIEEATFPNAVVLETIDIRKASIAPSLDVSLCSLLKTIDARMCSGLTIGSSDNSVFSELWFSGNDDGGVADLITSSSIYDNGVLHTNATTDSGYVQAATSKGWSVVPY